MLLSVLLSAQPSLGSPDSRLCREFFESEDPFERLTGMTSAEMMAIALAAAHRDASIVASQILFDPSPVGPRGEAPSPAQLRQGRVTNIRIASRLVEAAEAYQWPESLRNTIARNSGFTSWDSMVDLLQIAQRR